MPDELAENVLLVAAPNGIDTTGPKKRLKISLVMSPFAQGKAAPGVNRWGECKILNHWVTKTRTWKKNPGDPPAPATLALKLYQRKALDPKDPTKWERGAELPNSLKLTGPDWTSLRKLPAGLDVLAKGEALWEELFLQKDNWISLEKTADDPTKSTSTATPTEQPTELSRALRRGESTIEGVTSDEMNLMIGCGLAMETSITTIRTPAPQVTVASSKAADQASAVAAAVRELIPSAALPVWNSALRRMDHVIQRQEQVGTAGGVSQAYSEALTSTGKDLSDSPDNPHSRQEERLGQEFHHRLSMLDSHPMLLRLLGLVVDVIVEVDEAALGGSKGDFLIECEITLTAGGLKCITQATACVLNLTTATFHAAAKDEANSRLSPKHGCVNPDYLDTAQWNLESGVRSVLRRHGFLRGIANEGGATVPSSEGISVFWREKPGTTSKPRTALLDRHLKDMQQGEATKGQADQWTGKDFFFAENLVMGYVPTIYRRQDSITPGKWLSVTGRKLTLTLPDKTTLTWEDEMALIPASAEAPQPLSGWIVDILHRKATAGDMVRKESWYYLVATASGFVVVHEDVRIDYRNSDSSPVRETAMVSGTEQKDRPKAVWDWLPTSKAATGAQQGSPLARLGKYVDFQGRWDSNTGCFIAENAALVPGSGLAGRILTDAGVSAHRLNDKDVTLIKIPIGQTSVHPVGEVVKEELTDPNYISPAYAFLRGNFGKPAKDIETAISKGLLHFQGRGDKAIAIVERFDKTKPATVLKLPSAPCPMRYAGQEGDVLVFTVEAGEGWEIGTTLAERLRSVRLRLDKNARIRTMLKPAAGTGPLVPTSIYQVSCRMEVKDGKAELFAENIIESAPATIVTFLRVEKSTREGMDLATFITAGNQEMTCLVHREKTRVRFPGLPDSAGGYAEDDEDTGWTPPSSSGSWQDMGMRLGSQDHCCIKVHLNTDTGKEADDIYQLDEVEVLWPDTASCYYARLMESPGRPENEISLYLLELDGAGAIAGFPGRTARLIVKDTTEIVSLPLGLSQSKGWRYWNHVPPGAGLLRISDTGTGDKKIEVVNLIQSRLVEIVEDSKTFQLMVHLPGTGRQCHPLSLDKDAFTGKQFGKWLDGFVNKDTDRAAVLKNLAEHSKGNGLASTIRIDSKGKVRTLVLRRMGQLHHTKEGNLYLWKTDGLTIPFVSPPEGKGEILTVEFKGTKDTEDTPPVLTVSAKPPGSSFLMQVQDVIDEMAAGADGKAGDFIHNRATTLVIHGSSGAGAFEPGTSLPAIVEVFGDNSGDDIAERRRDYGYLLHAAASSGFPLEVIAEPAIFIDNAHAPAADWTILRLSNTTKGRRTRIGDGTLPLAWVKIIPEVITAEDFEGSSALDPDIQFGLVIRKSGNTYRTPLFDGLTFDGTEPSAPDIPKNDQIIADDMVMHWNGWSLAVAPPHRINSAISPAGELPVIVKPSDSLKLPRLRFGSSYHLAMRVMDIAGNVVPLERYEPYKEKEQGAPGSFPFQPFGRGKESSRKDEKTAIPFLRFSPIAPPVLWQSSPYLEPTNPKDADPALVTEVMLFTDRAGLLSGKAASPAPRPPKGSSSTPRATPAPDGGSPAVPLPEEPVTISLLPPPANWRLAEVQGDFDGKTPDEVVTRVVSGRDWATANPYVRQTILANAPGKSPLPDSVIDSDAPEILVTVNLPGEPLLTSKDPKQPAGMTGSFILPATNRNPPAPREITIARSNGGDPVAHNVPLDHPTELEKLPEYRNCTTTLEFRPDADVQLRFHGLPARNPFATNLPHHHYGVFLEKHFLRNFILWAASANGGRLATVLNALDQHGTGTNNDVNSTEFRPILEELLKLLPDLLGRSEHFKNESNKSPAYLQALVSFLSHPWVSTPRTLRVRHVTNQPYQAPVAIALEMIPRLPGQMNGDFRAIFQVHRPSTGYLTIQTALEQEFVDDPRNDLPTVPDEEQIRIYEDPVLRNRALARKQQLADLVESMRSKKNVDGKDVDIKRQDLSSRLFLGRTSNLETLLTRPPLDLGMITPSFNSQVDPFGDAEVPISFVHDFQDTRHRKVYYRGIAHTRYGKEVAPALTETMPRTEHHYEENDAWRQVEVQATTAPTAPNVSDITVLFDWSSGGWRDGLWSTARDRFSMEEGVGASRDIDFHGAKGWHFSRTRKCGHRLWIERPWYSSGSGEKLAVLLWMDASIPWDQARDYCNLVSTWGVDPAFETQLPSEKFKARPEERPGLLTRENFVETWSTPMGLEARPPREAAPEGPAIQVEKPATDIIAAPDTPLPVGLAVYSPRFHPERKLWYVDVFTEPRSYTPFVSYMVARYQPCSIKGMALSVPQRLRMLQALPVRTLNVHCTNNGVIKIKVTLSGIFPDQNHRRVMVTIEKNPYLEEMHYENLEKDSDFNGYEFGWEPIQIQDGSGNSSYAVVVTDPDTKTSEKQPHGTVEITVRLPYVPLHRSIMEVLENKNEEEHDWPCRCLRLTVVEQELFPAAHHMLEDVRELPREIFSDQVLLPVELLDAARVINPVKKTHRPPAPVLTNPP